MEEQLYNLMNSTVFQILLIIWFVILVIWKSKRDPVFARITNLIRKPVIFRKDIEPDNVPTYPRGGLEDIADTFRRALTEPFQSVIKALHSGLGNLVKWIFDSAHPFRTVGYTLLLLFFLLLVYSDAVAVANTLLVLNLSTEVPPFLAYFDLAVFAGSLIALILGFAFIFETIGSRSEFTAMAEREPRIKRAYFALALFVCALSVISLIAWGLARYVVVENADSSIIDKFVTFVVVFVVPFNSALAAAMIFNEAVRGFVVLIALIGYVAEGALYLLNLVATALGSLLPFLFDIVYRVVHVAVDVLIWVITTPIFALFWPFSEIYKLVASGGSNDSNDASRPRVDGGKNKKSVD